MCLEQGDCQCLHQRAWATTPEAPMISGRRSQVALFQWAEVSARYLLHRILIVPKVGTCGSRLPVCVAERTLRLPKYLPPSTVKHLSTPFIIRSNPPSAIRQSCKSF